MNVRQQIVRATIRGRVQGVGYRAWVVREAERRGVTGWVRNRSNGDVEAVFFGEPEAVEALCAACWRGPPLARVEGIDVVAADEAAVGETGMGSGFRQIATL
ncbi:acylphosphatase [Methylocapsa aurea]|uniref:acylphosphatase n=1 Tax=Methylocapsa aurea TaxID=663610 RepID=UPI0005680EEE|nr:acylphosphatase [Methylocapsa aurea]